MKYACKIDDLERAICGCLHCNRCHYGTWPDNHEICPIFSYDRCFTHSAGGLMYLAKALIKGQTHYSQELAELVYTCSGCRGCDDLCMLMRAVNPQMPLSDIIRLMRHELVQRGFIPQKLQKMHATVKQQGDLSEGGRSAALSLPAGINDSSSQTVLYADCFHPGSQAAMFASTLSVLQKIGQPVALHSSDGCCGSTLFDYGFWDQLSDLVSTKAQKLNTQADKTFVFVNPHCQEFITQRYEMITADYQPIKALHISELIVQAQKDGKLESKNGPPLKVSYHDPCMLGRSLGLTEPPRQALAALKNVELIEMTRNRKDTFCCGARAAGNYFEDFAEHTAAQRIAEFKATGADVLVTACPYCHTLFKKVLGDQKECVKDLVELVDERTL